MNDRASAAPPVQFIGPESFLDVNNPSALRTQPSARALRTKPSAGIVKPSVVSTIRPVGAEDQQKSEAKPSQKTQNGTKRGSKQLLGQVWDGMMERFRIKKDTTPAPTANDTAKKSVSDDRPSKEEVHANYHQLVASGFFSSHAIQSTRQPGPAAQRPSTSQANGPAPQWPLPQLPLTPNKCRPGSPIKSPTSASSRGTKRAKDDGSDEDDEDAQVKKLRKTVSTPRDLAIPKRRSSSRLAGKRTFSNHNFSSTQHQAPQGNAGREPNKLTKRVLNRLPLSIPDRGSSTAARRNVSDMIPPAAPIHEDGTKRTLRPRRSAADIGGTAQASLKSGALRVRPNANRGIPSVPGIPAKFTYGEDRENDGPWRGLRRGLN